MNEEVVFVTPLIKHSLCLTNPNKSVNWRRGGGMQEVRGVLYTGISENYVEIYFVCRHEVSCINFFYLSKHAQSYFVC